MHLFCPCVCTASAMRLHVLLLSFLLACLHHARPAAAALSATERIFLDGPTAEGAREHLRYYTSQPHMAGTPEDLDTALYTQRVLESYGFQVELQPFRALTNYPVSRSLVMTAPVAYTPELTEAVYESDSTSNTTWRDKSFNGYGASGDVEAEVIYANYGSADDFAYLSSLGISMVGKIALVRYGKVFRGLKVQNAELAGAIGCLIYSDPADDGFTKGAVYDNGPWRPESGVQRGSVQFLSRCSGDPGFLERDPDVCGYPTSELIPKIPSLPLSYGDALPILENLSGPLAPPEWRGGLATEYKGATDPSSGSAAMLELARGFGALLQSGWRPQREIVLASWDGEEYGLLGSVHWAEKNAFDLQRRVVALLNVDVGVTGRNLSVEGSASLASLARAAAADIPYPTSTAADGLSMLDAWAAQTGINPPPTPEVGVLGSGSDFAPFLSDERGKRTRHHLGIPALDCGYDGDQGVYHSDYDSFHWMESFGDPTFEFHKGIAQLWGLLALRIADAPVLPLRADETAQALPGYLETVKQHATSAGMATQLDFSALADAINAVQAPSLALESRRLALLSDPAPSQSALSLLNSALTLFERTFLITPLDGFVAQGLPGRPWFRHVLQAPGIDTGYAASVFPAVSDQLSAKNASAAQVQVDLLAAKLHRVASSIAALSNGCTGLSAVECLGAPAPGADSKKTASASSCAWFVPIVTKKTWNSQPQCVGGFDPCTQRLGPGAAIPASGAEGVFIPNPKLVCAAAESGVGTLPLRVIVLPLLLLTVILWLWSPSILPSAIAWGFSLVLLLAVGLAISVDPARFAAQRSAAEVLAIVALVVGLLQLQDVLSASPLREQIRHRTVALKRVVIFPLPLIFFAFTLPLGLLSVGEHTRAWSLAMAQGAVAMLSVLVHAHGKHIGPRSMMGMGGSSSSPSNSASPTGLSSGLVHADASASASARRADGHQLLEQQDEDGSAAPDLELHEVAIQPDAAPEPHQLQAGVDEHSRRYAQLLLYVDMALVLLLLALLALVDPSNGVLGGHEGNQRSWTPASSGIGSQYANVLVTGAAQDPSSLGGLSPAWDTRPSAEERACGVMAFVALLRAGTLLTLRRGT